MKTSKGYFTLPTGFTPSGTNGRQRVVVVAVFGKSNMDSGGSKVAALEAMLGRHIFQRNLIHPVSIDQDTLCSVEGYYHTEQRVLYLHLTGAYDTSALISSLENMQTQLQEKGFLMAWSSLKLGYARSLLLLFSISHLLLLCHPTHVFDISYIHLFRTLDAVRIKAQNHLSEILRSVSNIGKDWVTYGRLCAPRVLFIFSSHLLPPHVLRSNQDSSYSQGGRSIRGPRGQLRKLELALEDQIYHLLRKSRVITNISANSLFALPNNQAFVYILEDGQEEPESETLLGDTLHSLCSHQDSLSNDLNQLHLGTPTSSINMLDVSISMGLNDGSISADSLSASILSAVATERKRNLDHSFKVFLMQHIDQALGRGFDDNIGRHAGPHFFQVPKAAVWFEAVNKIYKFLMEDSSDIDSKSRVVLNSLRSLVETELRFSDARCAKVLPLAVAAYKDGLPPHYTQMHHQEKLEVALNVLGAQARGPMYEEYVGQLESLCEAVWHDGRMGCETLSLTGNTCNHPLHTTPGEQPLDPDNPGPVMAHNSGVVYVSFCNCGHRQGQREDPFTPKAANYDFYAHCAETCCNQLETVTFPTFKPSGPDAKAAKMDEVDGDKFSKESALPSMSRESRDKMSSDTTHTPVLSLAGTGGLSGSMNSNSGTNREPQHVGSQVIITLTKDEIKSSNKERSMVRQASTTEYLPGMLHTTSPAGLLPRWSSWSLVCLGPSSLYSHNAGICDQPMFLPGSNFLLPWDVTVKIEDRDKWPAIADTMGKKALHLKNKKNRPGGDHNEFSVKIFLGVEYECIRGHRFMMSSPDRHLKASPSGLVKDNATKIANADMPLYFPCPCSRGGSVVLGQLLRLHIVTPKAPVNVTLNPQVQPGPEPCPHYVPKPQSMLPIKLSASAYWVLRLPYVYVGDTGPHYPPDPRQPTPPSFAKLLKGCYGITQVILDR